MKACTKCGARDLVKTTHVYRRGFDGRSFLAELAATRCGNCGELLVSGPAGMDADKAITLALARSGEVGPQGFRWLRRAAGLEGKRLAELLDVSAGTVSRWENGKRALDRGAVALVCALALQEEGEPAGALELLEGLAARRRPPRRVRLEMKHAS